jgi:hypothetical protein
VCDQAQGPREGWPSEGDQLECSVVIDIQQGRTRWPDSGEPGRNVMAAALGRAQAPRAIPGSPLPPGATSSLAGRQHLIPA